MQALKKTGVEVVMATKELEIKKRRPQKGPSIYSVVRIICKCQQIFSDMSRKPK